MEEVDLAKPALGLSWDYERAERVIRFVEEFVRVPEGADVGKRLRLRDWQKKFLLDVYKTRGGVRPCRRAVLSMGRKNGKTSLLSALILVHLCGPEARLNGSIFSTARSQSQSAILFDLASKIRLFDARLKSVLHNHGRLTSMISHPASGSTYRAIASNASSAHGLSPTFVVHDELGQVPGQFCPIFDAMETAVGAHREPLSIVISTQAPTDDAVLSTIIDDILNNPDDSHLVHLYSAPDNASLTDEESWKAANPAYGDFLHREFFLDAASRAIRSPSFEPVFRNLHLNQRVSTSATLVTRNQWEKGASSFDVNRLAGNVAWAGLDLSSRNDLTAFVLLVKDQDGVFFVIPHFFLPRDGLEDRELRDRVPYRAWADAGFLHLCPGGSIDLRWVVHRVLEASAPFSVQKMAFDRWRIEFFQTLLDSEGAFLPLEPYEQTFRAMSPAVDEFEALISENRLVHGGHPVLRWNILNAMVVSDPSGNRRIDKRRSNVRVDGAVALLMAVGAMMRSSRSEVPSFWEEM